MGIFDAQMEFSDSQRVCNGGAAEESTNVYDWGVASPNVGKGERVRLLFNVTEAFAGTATTLTVTVQSSSDNAVLDAYANIVGLTTGAIPKASLVAGYEFEIELAPGLLYERYMRIMYTGDNTFETTGQIDCRMAIDRQTNRSPGA